ncbi:ABC transporter ATP-binding protein [Bacillus sp. OK048]|uniref:ABC transporter ATP-binding protein n=1 Tax=Bacillus sp. OK048 TaxID=1882761 RepID=UPI000B815572|nr:ABC transporter ATP-binding protein [Bacillus sp. OK048]
MHEPIIHIKNMQKEYVLGGETVLALQSVSIDIQKGDFISIIGPSGSGKSTFMNMIGCLDRPDSGEYFLDNEEIGKMKSSQLATIRNEKIGFIFQNFNLISKLTAVENVELPLIYRGMKAAKRRETALEALEKVGLADRANHLPSQLSGGQQQRVAIARALAGHPPILLADEPTGALDSKTSKGILGILHSLNEQGHTIILITHDLDVAKKANRVVRIHDGQLYENGGEWFADTQYGTEKYQIK